MKSIVLLFLAASVVAAQESAEVTHKASKDGKSIVVSVGGKPFAEYRKNETHELPKPFLLPLRAADGTVLTRSLENPEDHPHHKGVWVSVDEVNEIDFWAEKGKILTVSSKVTSVAKKPTRIKVTNSWQSLDGKPAVEEQTVIQFFPNRLVTYDIRFVAKHGPVEFGDTKEGLFGFRMVNSLREKETGKVINADGKKGSGECWGQPSAWVDYYGQIEGKTYGVALFDYPKNMRKSRYHVRNYGLFSISPFGEKAYTKGKEEAKPVKLAKGETLQLRYGLYIHDGDTKAGKVAEAYKQFLSLPTNPSLR
ncbi:MAG: PmoA family protein [Planctomycetaceae bacterium]